MNAQAADLQVKITPRNTSEIASRLRAEVQKNPAFSAICHVFSMRERARNQVTLSSLSQTMEKSQFKFSKAEYANALRTLASFGIGKLDADAKGKIKALKDIKVTLQSVGSVAVGEAGKLETFRQRNSFQELPVPKAKTLPPIVKIVEPAYPIALVVTVHDEDIHFPLNFKLTGGQIAALIQNLQQQAVLK